MKADTPTVFCLATQRLIDLVRRGESAATALNRLQSYGLGLAILPLAAAQTRNEAQFKAKPVEIDEATWHEALCVLPHHDWRKTTASESFKSSELTAGTVTTLKDRPELVSDIPDVAGCPVRNGDKSRPSDGRQTSLVSTGNSHGCQHLSLSLPTMSVIRQRLLHAAVPWVHGLRTCAAPAARRMSGQRFNQGGDQR